MKKIVKMFGSAILYSLCAVCVFAIVFFRADATGEGGILQRVGQSMTGMHPVESAAEYDTYKSQCQSFPEASCTVAESLSTGVYGLEAIVKAYDYMGNPVQVKLCSVTLPDGTVKTEVAGASSIVFDERGIYTLKVKMADSWNREAVKEIRIPVNSAGNGW